MAAMRVARVGHRLDKLVELGVQRLGIAIGGAVDEQRDNQGQQRRDAVPIERMPLDRVPHAVNASDEQKRRRRGGPFAELG